MDAQSFGQFFSKKAFEISYALFRISSHVEKKNIGAYLEEEALRLLRYATAGEYTEARRTLVALEYLLRLASEVNLVRASHAALVLKETKALDLAIAEFQAEVKSGPAGLEEIFSKVPAILEEQSKRTTDEGEPLLVPIGEIEQNGIPEPIRPRHDVQMRQSAILERIRQSGSLPDGPLRRSVSEASKAGCRLRDIQKALPYASERTIRYDLRGLIERRLVERVGSGGPATYYRLPNSGPHRASTHAELGAPEPEYRGYVPE